MGSTERGKDSRYCRIYEDSEVRVCSFIIEVECVRGNDVAKLLKLFIEHLIHYIKFHNH